MFINGHAYKLYKLFKDILNDVKTKGDWEINEASNITTLKSIFSEIAARSVDHMFSSILIICNFSYFPCWF